MLHVPRHPALCTISLLFHIDVLEMAIISNNSVVAVGESLVLVCVGFGQPGVNFTWSKNGQELSEDISRTLIEEDVEIGGRLYKQSLLRLCSLQTCHSDIYNCSITNGISVVQDSVELTVEGNLWVVSYKWSPCLVYN